MRPRLQTELFRMLSDHPPRLTDRLVSFARDQAVPNLGTIRRLQALKRQLEEDGPSAHERGLLLSLNRWFYLWYCADLLDLIARHEPPGLRPSDADIRRIAREMTKTPEFRYRNRKVRQRHIEMGTDMPYTPVREHSRDGRPTRGHLRYLGNHHLADLPVGRYPEFVGRIVRVLMTQRAYVPRPTNRIAWD